MKGSSIVHAYSTDFNILHSCEIDSKLLRCEKKSVVGFESFSLVFECNTIQYEIDRVIT